MIRALSLLTVSILATVTVLAAQTRSGSFGLPDDQWCRQERQANFCEVRQDTLLGLSSVDVEKFGYPSKTKVGDKPIPYLTADVLKGVPGLVSVGWAVLGGIWWISNRRDIVAAAEKKEER